MWILMGNYARVMHADTLNLQSASFTVWIVLLDKTKKTNVVNA